MFFIGRIYIYQESLNCKSYSSKSVFFIMGEMVGGGGGAGGVTTVKKRIIFWKKVYVTVSKKGKYRKFNQQSRSS